MLRNSLRGCRCRHNAFTLIELLVVIAIIAVLAAILFPVFAQAKNSAKASASLSNAKQQGLSILMYGNDFDDYFVIGGQWQSNDPDACKGYPSSWYMPWTGLTELYKKNLQINQSPHVGPTRVPYTFTAWNTCITPRQCALLYPTYGYNVSYLSPTMRVAPYQMTGLSQNQVARPAEQVVITEIWSPNNTTFGAIASGQDRYYISFASAEPPDGVTIQAGIVKPYSADGWGTRSLRNNQIPTEEEGRFTAGVAFRSSLMTPVVFADGHAKRMTAEQLARGTNWKRGVSGYATVTRVFDQTYLWDPQGL